MPYIDINQPQVYMCPQSWSPLPPPSPCPCSGLSQLTGFDCPVSCIKLGLVISFTYDNIHVSMLFFQIIPPSPSLTESKSLFFISVSLLLSHVYGCHYHLSKFHIYALIYCIGVFLSDFTLYNMLQFHPPHYYWFKCVLFNSWVYSIVYMYQSFLIHLSADGHLGCFHALAIVNSAVINIEVHVSLSILVFSVCMASSGIAGLYGSSISSFFKESPHCSP